MKNQLNLSTYLFVPQLLLLTTEQIPSTDEYCVIQTKLCNKQVDLEYQLLFPRPSFQFNGWVLVK